MIISIGATNKIPDHFIEIENEIDAKLTAVYLAENLRDGLTVRQGFVHLRSGEPVSDETWAGLVMAVDGVKPAIATPIEDGLSGGCNAGDCSIGDHLSNKPVWSVKILGELKSEDRFVSLCDSCLKDFRREGAIVRYKSAQGAE